MYRLQDGLDMRPGATSDGSGGERSYQILRSSNPNPDYGSRAPLLQGPPSEELGGVSEFTYHCDDLPLLLPNHVDSRALPPRETARCLLEAYMDSVHPAFPIIGKNTFEGQVEAFLNDEQLSPGRNWLAVLNLVFAIAAKYSHYVEASWRGDERDHLLYFARARMLGMNEESIFDHPDLQRVQVSGLIAFYFATVDQVNRYGMSKHDAMLVKPG